MKIREQKSAEGLMVEMLHGAAVGQEGRLSLLCSARLRRGRLAARVLTRFNLSPRSPPPHPSCPNPLTGALKLSPPLSPLPLSPPSSPSFGRPDRRWPFPGRRWACTLKRSCRRCFQARTSPKPQKPSLRMRRSGRRKRRTQRTTSYSRDANGWKRTRRSSTSNSDWMRSEDCLPRLPDSRFFRRRRTSQKTWFIQWLPLEELWSATLYRCWSWTRFAVVSFGLFFSYAFVESCDHFLQSRICLLYHTLGDGADWVCVWLWRCSVNKRGVLWRYSTLWMFWCVVNKTCWDISEHALQCEHPVLNLWVHFWWIIQRSWTEDPRCG